MVLATVPTEFSLFAVRITLNLILVVGDEDWVALLRDSARAFLEVREITSICAKRCSGLSI